VTPAGTPRSAVGGIGLTESEKEKTQEETLGDEGLPVQWN